MGAFPVIAGTGANSTSEAIALTSKAKQLGLDACLLVTPYYNKPTQEGLYQHFKTIAEAVDIAQDSLQCSRPDGPVICCRKLSPGWLK